MGAGENNGWMIFYFPCVQLSAALLIMSLWMTQSVFDDLE